MAGTYYKYAERQAEDQVNWFQVGKDITDMLKKETDTREAKKKAIDDASSQFGQELANAPQGNADDVNRWTTNYAGDMQEYRLMTDKLLKSGQLKVKDYSLIRQNSTDGTKNLFNLSKEYQAEFDAKTKRRMEDKSSASETQFMAMVEGFANLGNTKALIDPPSGAISVGKLTTGPDGVKVLAEGNDNYMTVNQLRQRIKQNIDKYQLNDSLEAETKLMGDVVKEAVTKTGTVASGGFITKITDQTLRKGLAQEGQQAVDAYINLENKIVEAQLSNPQHTSSVLFDWTGGIDPKTNKPYQVTLDPKKAESDSSYILWGYKDGIFQPDFESTANGKEQYKEAEKYVKTKLRGMLEQKTEIKATPQAQLQERRPKTEGEMGRESKLKTAKNVAQNLVYSLTGNANESTAGTQYLSSSTGLPFTKTKEGYNFIDENGNEQKFKFKADGKTLADPAKFTKSFIGTIARKMQISEDDVLEEFGKLLPKGAKINLTTEAKGFEEQPITDEEISAKITPDLFTIKSKKSAGNLNSILPSGFKAEDIGGVFGNDVKVTAANGKTYVYNANVGSEQAEKQKASLAEFIKINSGGKSGTGGTGELD
jgi:hypothetical protein